MIVSLRSSIVVCSKNILKLLLMSFMFYLYLLGFVLALMQRLDDSYTDFQPVDGAPTCQNAG